MDPNGQVYFDDADKVPDEDTKRLLMAEKESYVEQLRKRSERNAMLKRLSEDPEADIGTGLGNHG